MNGSILLASGTIIFAFFYRFYGRYLNKVFGLDVKKSTPAYDRYDGVDYVPAGFWSLFGHHFASIAGAGPIVGPIIGAVFGWGPVFLWIILGCVFIGGLHDYSSLFISVREKGLSIGYVIEKYISYSGRQIFLFFCFIALILVVAIFAILVAKTFVTIPSTATSSIIFIFMAPIFGVMVNKNITSFKIASIFFVPLVFLSVYLGVLIPLDISLIFNITKEQTNHIWLIFLFIYVFIASVVPVWILLQPRDYLNSFLLYGMIILGVFSILIVSPTIHLPKFTDFSVLEPYKNAKWNLFPILFVTVACGACSGFHALVSSGTTSKQIACEKHILPIGYGAMLLEGVLGIIALISVSVLSYDEYCGTIVSKGPVMAFANGLANISVKMGLPLKIGENFIALTISAFMLTTLDTATRLARLVVHEILLPKEEAIQKKSNFMVSFFNNRYIATLIVVILSYYLAVSGSGNKIWPVFGASNQLLAALTLFLIAIILMRKKKNYWIALVPFLFMIVMSFYALVSLLFENIKDKNISLVIASVFLIFMSFILILIALKKVFEIKKTEKKVLLKN